MTTKPQPAVPVWEHLHSLRFHDHAPNDTWYIDSSRCSYIATRTPRPVEDGIEYKEPSSPRIAGQLCLHAPIDNAEATTLGALMAWATPLVAPKPCVTCEGTGIETQCSVCKGEGVTTCYCNDCDNEHMRECKACRGDGVVRRGLGSKSETASADAPECGECDGLGWTWLNAIEASVGGTTVDLANLINVIAASGFDMNEPVRLGSAQMTSEPRDGGFMRILLIDGATWRIGLMPLRVEDVRDSKPVVRPVFDPKL